MAKLKKAKPVLAWGFEFEDGRVSGKAHPLESMAKQDWRSCERGLPIIRVKITKVEVKPRKRK